MSRLLIPDHGSLGKRLRIRTTSSGGAVLILEHTQRFCGECGVWSTPATFVDVYLAARACPHCGRDWSDDPADGLIRAALRERARRAEQAFRLAIESAGRMREQWGRISRQIDAAAGALARFARARIQ